MTGRGGRGDRLPPQSLYPLPNGGDFLQHHLLNRPPYQPHPLPVPAPIPYLHRDPAFQSNGHDPHFSHHPSWRHSTPVAPHNYFHHQTYPQNPNPNPNYSSPSPFFHSEFNRNRSQHHHHHNPQFNHQYVADDSQRQSFFGYNHGPSFVHPQSVQDGNLNRSVASAAQFYKQREIDERHRRLNGLLINSQNSPNIFQNPSVNRQAFQNQEIGRKSSGGSEVRQPPPVSKPSKNRRRKFEQNVDKEKTRIGKLSRGVSNLKNEEEDGEKRVLLERKKPRGDMMVETRLAESSNLHLVSAPDSEERVLELHSEVGEDGARGELDMQPLGPLVLEIGFDEKKATKPRGSSRGKGRRSDARGNKLLRPNVRKSKKKIVCRSDIHRLNAPFLAIYESLMPPEEEKVKKKQLLTLLEKLITKEWPEARMYVFGSCANSFAVLKSDIDVCLTIENPNVNKSEALMKLADMLRSENFQNVQALTHARIPIVKLMEPVTGISCDISMNNVLAVENTKLLRDYAQIDVRLRQLALIVKHWAKARGVNETYRGTLSSYAYVLMCIQFLQQRKPAILPCLQEMERTYAVTVENVECAYFHEVEKLSGFGSSNMESISQLVWGFFNYWAYWHDYSNNVISVRTGSIFRKHNKNWTRKSGNQVHLLSIEDPFEIYHDLGRVVDGHTLRVLKEEFERAAIILQDDPDPCVKLFEPYVS